jgi:hypothetical protein
MTAASDTRDIARAIRRASEGRLALRKRRRRSFAVGLGLPLTAIIGFGVWTASANGVDVVHAATRHTQDLIELLDQRSPGARTAAQLTKTKRLHEALASDRRALPPRPSLIAKPVELADLLSAPVSVSLPQIGAPLAPLSPALFSGGSVASGPSDSPGEGSPGSSSLFPPGTESTASLPSDETKIPIADTPAVPEPQSWALMLIGFALVGWKVRRSSAKLVQLKLAAARR